MYTKLKTTLSILALAGAATAATAAQAAPNDAAAYGEPAAMTAAARTVVLKDGARYLNVADGETVRIVHDGRSFTWTFDTVGSGAVVPLARLDPHDPDLAGVTVYVAPNPLYNNA